MAVVGELRFGKRATRPFDKYAAVFVHNYRAMLAQLERLDPTLKAQRQGEVDFELENYMRRKAEALSCAMSPQFDQMLMLAEQSLG